MSLTVIWEEEDGTLLDKVEDPANVLHRVLPKQEDTSFQILRFIDWYGDTLINRLQLKLFLKELESVSAGCSPEEQNVLSKIQDLAVRAMGKQHTYLKFYGD